VAVKGYTEMVVRIALGAASGGTGVLIMNVIPNLRQRGVLTCEEKSNTLKRW
jgi:hypothetical protein